MSNDIDWSGWTEEFPLWVESHAEGWTSAWHRELPSGGLQDRDWRSWSPYAEERGHITIHHRPTKQGLAGVPVKVLIEPSDDERSGLPLCTAVYLDDLEADNCELRTDLKAAIDMLEYFWNLEDDTILPRGHTREQANKLLSKVKEEF